MQIIPQCANCVHLLKEGKCKAFPKGIPDEIFINGTHDHNYPFQNDNGIRFEPVNKKDEPDND